MVEVWELMENPEFEIHNIELKNVAKNKEKTLGAFDLAVFINDKLVNNLQSISFALAENDDSIGLVVNMLFFTPTRIEYKYKINLRSVSLPEIVLVEKV